MSRTTGLMETDRGVDVVSPAPQINVQDAADRLNVSRPFLMSLLRRCVVPHRVVGTHHRIPLGDPLAKE